VFEDDSVDHRLDVRSPLSVVYAREAQASLLQAALPQPLLCVRSAVDLVSATAIDEGVPVAFVDLDLLPHIDRQLHEVPIIAIAESKPQDMLACAVRALARYPWLAHVLSSQALTAPRARGFLAKLLARLAVGPAHPVLGEDGIGRVALLACASRRQARLQRMREFFGRHQLTERAITTLLEVGEELVMNALYDAPAEAGYFKRPRSRTEHVELPDELACQISYGIEDGTAFVRVRDPFGALSRERVVNVLTRCNRPEVTLDESRGGAGLGMWRVFSVASQIAITVVPGSFTEVLVGIRIKDGRAIRQLEASRTALILSAVGATLLALAAGGPAAI